jgi:predicted RND superfamily exporter protein
MMQNSQLLEIFCASMQKFESAVQHLEAKEKALNKQSHQLVTIVGIALMIVFIGIAAQVWFFATNMGKVVNDVNQLTKNMGYIQGIFNGMSTRVAVMEGSVQSVPNMVNLLKSVNERMPLLVNDIAIIEDNMSRFDNNISRLDTSLTGINGSMYRLNFQMHIMSEHTHNFARIMP